MKLKKLNISKANRKKIFTLFLVGYFVYCISPFILPFIVEGILLGVSFMVLPISMFPWYIDDALLSMILVTRISFCISGILYIWVISRIFPENRKKEEK